MTDLFDLLETKFGFLRVNSGILSAKVLEYSSYVEELYFGFTVYFAYLVAKTVEDIVLHTALKVRVSIAN